MLGLVCFTSWVEAAEDYAVSRARLVTEISQDVMDTSAYIGKSALDERVMRVLGTVGRHRFVPPHLQASAYENRPLPIGYGQTISQPYIVALMTDLLELEADDVVLEIGTGSGYQAAVLSRLCRRVYTVDRHRRLVQEAEAIFRQLDLPNITAQIADGSRGLPDQAPFDRILVTAAAEDPPGPLLAQLKIGGIMVVPVGQSDAVQTLIRVTRTDAGFEYDELRQVRFVPLVEGLGQT